MLGLLGSSEIKTWNLKNELLINENFMKYGISNNYI